MPNEKKTGLVWQKGPPDSFGIWAIKVMKSIDDNVIFTHAGEWWTENIWNLEILGIWQDRWANYPDTFLCCSIPEPIMEANDEN